MKVQAFLSLAAAAVSAVSATPLSARLLNPNPIVKPSGDGFYKVPGNVASYASGDIIRERDVTYSLGAGLTPANYDKAYQLLFRTQTALGKPDATVTTVFKPKVPANPPQIVSVALFEDSAAFDCATSYALTSFSSSQQALITTIQTSTIDALLAKGIYVTAPDYEGSQAAFIAGYAEGRVQLDSTRAILNHRKTIANPAGNRVILSGYSGGGHSAAWSSQLYPEYAPELNIVGAAIGGLPVDLRAVLVNLNKGLFAGFAAAGLAGQANAYPEVQSYLDSQLLPNGTEAFKFLRSDQGCVIGELGAFAFKDIFTYVKKGIAVLDDPVPVKYFKLNLLGGRGQQDVLNKFPLFIYHARNDEVIPRAPVDQYVKDQCAAGASINYSLSDGTEHVSETLVSIPAVLSWIFKRFDGTLKQTGCTMSTHSPLGNSDLVALMGKDAAAEYQKNAGFDKKALADKAGVKTN